MKTETTRFPLSSALFRFSTAAAIVALLLRFCGMFSEFQYDEWWTLLHFVPLSVPQILTDLSLPNNHPLNTLILKTLALFFSDPILLRAGCFLAGAAFLFLSARFAGALWGKWAAAATLWLIGCSAPVLLYTTTARGYIYQLLALILAADALRQICCRETTEKTFFPEIQLIAGGIALFLSVSTGIFWLAVLGGVFLLYAPASVYRRTSFRIAAGILCAAVLLYYGMLFPVIRQGTRWGTAFPTLLSRFVFLGKTILLCGFPFFAPWIWCAIRNDEKKGIVLLLSLLPLFLSACTVGGPERVFLPMTLLWTLLAACGFSRMMEKSSRGSSLFVPALLLTAAVLLLPWGVWRKETPAADWHKAREMTAKKGNALLILRSSAAYPAMLNSPVIPAQWAAMLSREPETLALIGGTPGTINGADASFAEKEIPLPVAPEETEGNVRLFSLTKKNHPEAGQCYLIISTRPKEDEKIFSPAGTILTLNLFFSLPGKRVFVWKCGEQPPNLSTAGMPFYLIGGKRSCAN